MILDLDSLAIGLSLVFILTIGVVVVVLVLTRAGRQPPGGLMWDEMNAPAEPRIEPGHVLSSGGNWPPPSGGLDPTGRQSAEGANAASSANVSSLIPL